MAKTKKQTKRPAFPCVFTEDAGFGSQTEAGADLCDTLERLVKAGQSTEGFAEWEAQRLVSQTVATLREGTYDPLPIDLAAQPLLFVAAQAVNAWIQAHTAACLARQTKQTVKEPKEPKRAV